MTEHHFSYRSDGHRHRTVRASGSNAAHLGRHKSVAIADIQTWVSLRSIAVPLIEPFGWKMDAGAWRDVQRPKILRSEDFDGADGIYLHGFICRSNQVRNLVRKWRVATRHWSTRDGDNLRLVVLAEPMVARGVPVIDNTYPPSTTLPGHKGTLSRFAATQEEHNAANRVRRRV